MFYSSKLQTMLKKNKQNGQRLFVGAAAAVSVVASGNSTPDGNTNVAPSLDDGVFKVNLAENSNLNATLPATDANGDTLTYALSGDDADKFNLNGATGAVTFKTAPNFEEPTDAGTNNVYYLTVTATDRGGLSDSRDAETTVTNVNEGMSFAAAAKTINVVEGQTAVTSSVGTVLVGDVPIYTLSGADEALFTVSTAGVVRFKVAPDFETKADFGGDGVYDIVLTATDEAGLFATQTIVLTVEDVNEAPVFAVSDAATMFKTMAAEGVAAVASFGAIDVDAGDVINDALIGTVGVDVMDGLAGNDILGLALVPIH